MGDSEPISDDTAAATISEGHATPATSGSTFKKLKACKGIFRGKYMKQLCGGGTMCIIVISVFGWWYSLQQHTQAIVNLKKQHHDEKQRIISELNGSCDSVTEVLKNQLDDEREAKQKII